MIPQKIRILDEKELDLVEILTSIGIKRAVAVVIVYLSGNDGATSKQIEIATNLSQTAAAHPAASSGACKVPPHKDSTRLTHSILS